MKAVQSILNGIIALFSVCSLGQISQIQDKSGETSLLFGKTNVLAVNAADASFSLSLSYGKPKYFFGANLKLKSSEGITTLLDGYKFKPEFELGIFAGNYLLASSESVTQYMYYGLTFNTTEYSLLKTDNSNTFERERFYGGSIYTGYNRLGLVDFMKKDGLGSSYLFGVAFEYALTNNLEDLKVVQTYKTITVDDAGNPLTLLSDKKSGFSGEYSNFSAAKLKFDVYLFPQNLGGRIGLGGYGRTQFSGTAPRTSAGSGIILGEKDAPSNIVCGIFYQFNDLFNQLDQENEFLKRGGINIVAGYSF